MKGNEVKAKTKNIVANAPRNDNIIKKENIYMSNLPISLTPSMDGSDIELRKNIEVNKTSNLIIKVMES